MRDFLQDC